MNPKSISEIEWDYYSRIGHPTKMSVKKRMHVGFKYNSMFIYRDNGPKLFYHKTIKSELLYFKGGIL